MKIVKEKKIKLNQNQNKNKTKHTQKFSTALYKQQQIFSNMK